MKHQQRIEQAYKDAVQMAIWRANGIIPSRRFVIEQGWTQPRFQNAIALLRLARVIGGHRMWMFTDLQTVLPRLKTAKERALVDREVFVMRLNKHGRQ